MQLSLKVAITLSVLASTNLYAATTLVVPEDVKLLAVNMEKPKLEGGLFSDEKTIEIPDGTNQIVFKYQPEFEIGDDIKGVYGDAIIAKFDVKNEELKFELPEFKTYRQAQTNISPLECNCLTLKVQPIDLVEDVLESDGVQIGRNYAQEARNYNIAGGVAGVAVTVVTVNQHSQAVTGVEPKVVATTDAQSSTAQDSQMVDLLKTMYQKATPQEKETFKKWVAQQ
ncbi:LOW QUALITY PROTEIN: putative secreted protein [Vibrio sp. JCM 19052]|nr:LOW QUALITY PROTEIN: putative secreted protein [Vibrio sp. JCM 19052]